MVTISAKSFMMEWTGYH